MRFSLTINDRPEGCQNHRVPRNGDRRILCQDLVFAPLEIAGLGQEVQPKARDQAVIWRQWFEFGLGEASFLPRRKALPFRRFWE